MSLQHDYLLRYKQPWITFDAIDFLNSINLHDIRVFEYGSGGSTLYWLSKGAYCVSIEHEKFWYEKMKASIGNNSRLDYRLVEAEMEPEGTESGKSPAEPDDYISEEYAYHKCNYKKYVMQIDDFDDTFFDVVLIDGRARPSCIKHSIPKLRVGGVLILDNSDRAYYTEKTAQLLRDFDRQVFFGAVPQNSAMSTTSIYIKKK